MIVPLRIMWNEIHKGLLVSWHYKFNLLNEFITLGVNFVGTAILMNYGKPDLHTYGPALLGYIVWVYAYYVLNVGYTLTLEGRSGTLEQLYMSPVHPAIIFIGTTLATLTSSSIMIALMSFVLMIVCNITVPFSLTMIPILAITLIGLIGFGLGIAGAALLYKNVAGFVDLISTLLFYLNGSMLEIELLPSWAQVVARTLPTTQGIIVLRASVFDKVPILQLWREGSLYWLIMNSGLYFIGGLCLFLYAERLARQQGKLGLY
jgi:ABC-2 type transport system permease protein